MISRIETASELLQGAVCCGHGAVDLIRPVLTVGLPVAPPLGADALAVGAAELRVCRRTGRRVARRFFALGLKNRGNKLVDNTVFHV